MRQEKPIKALIECYQMIFNKTTSPIDSNEQNKIIESVIKKHKLNESEIEYLRLQRFLGYSSNNKKI